MPPIQLHSNNSIQSQNLADALQNLQSSLFILTSFYQSYIKLFLFAILIWLFYKLGRLSVSDQILKQKNKLSNLIHKRQEAKIKVPQKIQKLKKINILVLTLSLTMLSGIAIAHYTAYIRIVKYEMLMIGLIIILVLIFLAAMNFYRFYLSRKIKKANSLDKDISKKLNQFEKSLGQKVVTILKNNLCRQKLRIYNSLAVNQCQKQDCKQLRNLYKIRDEAMSNLIQQSLNFEWCSVCKKRQPFDQLLPFQLNEYVPKSENEQEQVRQRINYLVDGLTKMRDWIIHTNPCNCSKLYWNMSTQKILVYKKIQRLNESKIKEIQNRNKK